MVSKKIIQIINKLPISAEQKEGLHLLNEPRTAASLASELNKSYQTIAGWFMIWREKKWIIQHDTKARQFRYILDESAFKK